MARTRVVSGQQSILASTGNVHAPAANTDAVVTYAAQGAAVGTAPNGVQPLPAGYPIPANVRHVISGIHCTVFGAAAVAIPGPEVKIEDGSGNVVFQSIVPFKGSATGVWQYELNLVFPLPLKGSTGRAMIITMPANGSNTQNRLNILGHWTEQA